MAGGSKSVTVGYRYLMGVQLALTHGPVDYILGLTGDENVAWSGSVTDNATILVNARSLFGGEKREGGWFGYVDIMMGALDQPANTYLASRIAGPVPAFRGLTTVVFRGVTGSNGFEWSSGNPYFKPPAWRIARYVKGWSRGEAWYPTKAKIGRDMNPVHIVYECLTNLEWGMGYSPADIDDTNFKGCADQIYDEAFGISLLWMEQTSIQDFVKLVLSHIDANVRVNMKTGLFEMKLMRNNYDVATLNELNPSNIIAMSSFQRTAWGDTANEVVIKYTDRLQNEVTLAVQDLACIESQGALVSVTREYVGIREDSLATRVAMRDLGNISTPLAKVNIICNRIAWDWDVTDVFALTWPKLGLNRVPFRILKIIKGDLINGQITIEAIEDIFGLPASAYIQQQPSGWVDPISLPLPAVAPRAIEVPYWDIIRNTGAADMAYLPVGYAFGEVAAIKPTSDAFDFDIHTSPNNSVYVDTGYNGTFTPTGQISADIPIDGAAVAFTLVNMIDTDQVTLPCYAYIDNEAFLVTAMNVSTGLCAAGRATLDTVPKAHVAGTRVYFVDNGYVGADFTQRTSGETTWYKPLTSTGKGTLAVSAATGVSVTFVGRAEKPYPPANLRVNGAYFPAITYGAWNSASWITWANRNRLQQTVTLIPFTSGNITPEALQTTIVRLYSGTTLLRTYTVATNGTQWGYPTADDLTDGSVQVLRVTVASERSGSASWQLHDMTIDRHGLGFHLGEELGGVAP